MTTTHPARRAPVRGRLLSQILRADAAASLGMAAVFLALAGPVENLLGLPVALTLPAAAALLAWAAGLAVAAARPVPRDIVLAIGYLNVAWVLASVALIVFGWVELTALGVVFVMVQAVAVATAAYGELVGLSRASR